MKNFRKFISSLREGDIVQSKEIYNNFSIVRYMIALKDNGKINLFYGKWYGNNPMNLKSYGKIHDISAWDGKYSDELGYRDDYMYVIGNVNSFPVHRIEQYLGKYEK